MSKPKIKKVKGKWGVYEHHVSAVFISLFHFFLITKQKEGFDTPVEAWAEYRARDNG